MRKRQLDELKFRKASAQVYDNDIFWLKKQHKLETGVNNKDSKHFGCCFLDFDLRVFNNPEIGLQKAWAGQSDNKKLQDKLWLPPGPPVTINILYLIRHTPS